MVIGLMPHGYFLFPDPLPELAVREHEGLAGSSRILFSKDPTQVVQEPGGAGEMFFLTEQEERRLRVI